MSYCWKKEQVKPLKKNKLYRIKYHLGAWEEMGNTISNNEIIKVTVHSTFVKLAYNGMGPYQQA